MEMAVRSMETAETAMETDGDDSGGTSPSQQGAGTETSVPRNSLVVAAELRNSFWKIADSLGFSVPRLYIGEGATSGGCQGALTRRGHSQGPGRAALLCGALVAPLQLSFGLRYSSEKIRLLELVSSNSENISCVAFLKHKNSRKQGTGTVASCQ
jgi:hypothetical protein